MTEPSEIQVGDKVFFGSYNCQHGTVVNISKLDGSLLVRLPDGEVQIIKHWKVFRRPLERYSSRSKLRESWRKAFGLRPLN